MFVLSMTTTTTLTRSECNILQIHVTVDQTVVIVVPNSLTCTERHIRVKHTHTHILFQSYTYFSAHKCPCVLTQWHDMESSNPVTQKCVSSTIYKNSGCSKRIFVVIFGAVLMPQPLLASVAATTASVIVLLPYAPFQK